MSFVPQKGKNKKQNDDNDDDDTRVALFPEEINEDKRSNRAKRDEHSHLQFSSRWRVHQHGVLVSLRGHFQTLRQGRRTQRDRSGGGGGGGGGFDTTNARSSRNSGVSLCEGGSGLDRCARRQRRHPLFTVVWNELGLSARFWDVSVGSKHSDLFLLLFVCCCLWQSVFFSMMSDRLSCLFV